MEIMTDDEKDMVDEGVRKSSKSTTNVVMIFAPWCPHCHAAMGKFAEFAKSNPKTKCLLVKCRSTPKKLFAKGRCHFPTWYSHDCQKKVKSQEENVHSETKEESPAAELRKLKTLEPSPTDSSPTETEETEGEMLAKLF